MVERPRTDLVCLYLQAVGEAPGDEPAAGATAVDIATALEVGETAADRVGILDDLATLQAAGRVTAEERSVAGHPTPRTVYELTPAGREHARDVRAAVRSASVEVTNGTTEAVPLAEIGRYLDDSDHPLVTALARLTDDGQVPLQRHVGEQFVDRQEPLSTVQGAVERTTSHGSQTVVVAGAAGMGKTTLVREAIERAATTVDDLAVGTGTCREDAADPYGSLRRAFAELPDGESLVEPLSTADETVRPDDPAMVEAQRSALFDDVAAALRASVTDRPAVLVLENLQWADGATLSLFAHLATAITEWVYPVAFVGTYRTSAVAASSDHPLADVLETLAGATRYTHVELEPLARTDTRALLAGLVGRQQLPPAFVDLVHDHTGGVPLFVEATATHLLERGLVDPAADTYPERSEELALPAAVRDAVAARLDALDERSRQLLRLGAVVGEHVPGAVLSAASELAPARRREYTDLLVAANLWTWADPPGGQRPTDGGDDVRFVSGSVREAVVDALPAATAEDLNRRVAEALIAVDEQAVDARAARVAHHFEAAGRPARAREYYRRAGDHARDGYATEAALESYERALALGRDDEDAEPAELAALADEIAELHDTTGRFEAAIEAVEEGLALAPERSRAHCRLLGTRTSAEIGLGDFEDARETARTQRAVAADVGAAEYEAEALDRLGLVAFKQGDVERARERFEASLELLEAAGDREGTARNLRSLAAAAIREGDLERAREYLEDSIDVYRDLEDSHGLAKSLTNLGLVADMRGDLTAAREHLAASIDRYDEVGDRHGRGKSLGNLGLVCHRAGERDLATDHLETALDIARDVGDDHAEAKHLGNLGAIAYERGALGTARERYGACLAIERDLGDRRGQVQSLAKLGHVAAADGDPGEARARYREGLEIARELGDRRQEAQAHAFLAGVALRQGALASAREHADAGVEGSRDAGADVRAICRGVRGAVAVAEGDVAAGRERLEDARETLVADADLADELRVRRYHVEAELAGGDRDRAAALREGARERVEGTAEPTGHQLAELEERWTAREGE